MNSTVRNADAAPEPTWKPYHGAVLCGLLLLCCVTLLICYIRMCFMTHDDEGCESERTTTTTTTTAGTTTPSASSSTGKKCGQATSIWQHRRYPGRVGSLARSNVPSPDFQSRERRPFTLIHIPMDNLSLQVKRDTRRTSRTERRTTWSHPVAGRPPTPSWLLHQSRQCYSC